MLEIKNIIVSTLMITILFCSSCKSNHKNEIDDVSMEKNYIKFNKNIEDSITMYLSNLQDSCDILIQFDRSYVSKIYRFNIISIDKKDFNFDHLFFTILKKHKVYISTGLENLTSHQSKQNFVNCDGIMFVLYDSLGHLIIKENLNDFDEDLRPNYPMPFILK